MVRKECIVLNGRIINIGPWDLQVEKKQIGFDENESPIYEEKGMNPLPDGATTEEREFEYNPDRGWYEAGTLPQQTQEDFMLDLDFRLSLIELGV